MTIGEMAVTGAGILTLGVALGHSFFYRLFGWREELARLTPANRTVLYTIHVALYLAFVPMGLLSVVYAEEVARPGGLGGALALLLAAFWTWRLVWQVVYFRGLARSGSGWRLAHPALIALLAFLVAAYAGPQLAALATEI